MAKLSARGRKEVGRIESLVLVYAYMSDGTILEKYANTWTVSGKLKPGINPEDALRRACDRLVTQLNSNPALCAYYEALHQFSAGHRNSIDIAVSYHDADAEDEVKHLGYSGIKITVQQFNTLRTLREAWRNSIESKTRRI